MTSTPASTRPLNIKRFSITPHFEPEGVGFFTAAFTSSRLKWLPLDEIRAFIELLADSLPPLVRPFGDTRAPQRLSFGGVAARRRDKGSRGNNAGAGKAVSADPFFEPEGNVMDRGDVADAGDPALQIEPAALDRPSMASASLPPM